nr:retrovirus-related Pol polyprotein from transposon TNT 1-94 [Tanacetum cinerariifolium]
MMIELVRNQCDVMNHQVNVQFLLQLQPEWQRSQHATTRNKGKAIVNSPATRNKGKAIVNSPPPIYDQEPSMVAEDDEMSKDKEIDKLMALISLSFKKIYKPTNNNLRTSSNTSRAIEIILQGLAEALAYHKEKMLLCKQEEAGFQLNAEQADWRDNTDDKSDDQELEAHYIEQIDQDDDDLANEHDLLASLIEKLKCEIDDSKNCSKFLESSNKVLVDKLKGEIEDFKTKNKSLESSNNHFKEANNELSKTNQLMYKDLKKFQEELDRHNDVKKSIKVEKFLGTVKFGNDQIAPILGYGDLNSMCYIRDLKGNDLLTGSRGTDLYSISLQETSSPNPIYLMAKVTSSQAWLWHCRLSHLNFDTINLLSNSDIVIGLPKLKFIKDHLCSSYEHNMVIDSLDMSYDGEQVDQDDDDDDLANERNVVGARENVGTPVLQQSGIQCYNCKEYGHVAKECQKPKRAKDEAYHKEKMLLYKQEDAGFQLNAEQADWRDDTDDEPEDQELEAHYLYMAQIQEVTPDAADNSGPIFDSEPLQKVSHNDNNNVFAIESEHPEQSKSVNDTYLIEQDEHNVIKFYKTCEDKELDKVIALENKVKVLDNIVYKTGQSVQTMNMLNRNCKQSFAKPELLKKAQRVNPRLLNAKTSNVNFVCVTCGKYVLSDKHDMCVLHSRNGVNSRTKMPMVVPISTREPEHNVNQSVAKPLRRTVASESTNQKPRHTTRKLYEHVSKACSWWYSKFTPPGYKWKPKSQIGNVNPNLVEIILFIVNSGCSKHMMGNLKRLTNFVEKLLGSVKFRNDQIAPILGYGDVVQGTVTIKKVYYVKGLNHNLFSVGQFCDADLEVAFWKSTCYIRDLKGNDLLTGSRGTNLYSVTLQDTSPPNPICLMARATSSQAWLWHRRLSHLNFDTINLLSKNDIVIGLSKLKFIEDHLCSSCELGKAKRKSFQTKTTPSSKRR